MDADGMGVLWLALEGLPFLGAVTTLGLLLWAAWMLGHEVGIHLLAARRRGMELTTYGAWAVVTGATSGIGRAYAHELAKRGLNVVLISRSLQKLQQVAADIEEQHGRSTRVIETDFTQGPEIYESIQTALQGLEIGILVNNVGMMYGDLLGPVNFLDGSKTEKALSDILNCNMLSVAKMTRIVLPQMLTRYMLQDMTVSLRKKGVIINLSSEGGRNPLPMATMYSSTKAFVDFFSRSLEAEYHSQGILVQSVLPFFVSTNMTGNMAPNLWMKTPEDFAREALNTVGVSSRTSGCLSHSVQLPEQQGGSEQESHMLHPAKAPGRVLSVNTQPTRQNTSSGDKQLPLWAAVSQLVSFLFPGTETHLCRVEEDDEPDALAETRVGQSMTGL